MIPLETELYCHIYNRANGSDLLFNKDNDYCYFLKKYRHYIYPIAKTLAEVLMPNHFHFLVQIRSVNELYLQGFLNLGGIETQQVFLSKQYSNFFNCYTKSINKSRSRKGSLFCPNFKRKKIDSEVYLKKLINYIHFNPIVHGFVDLPIQWKYSSYKALLSQSTTLIDRAAVFDFFESRDNFLFCHQGPMDLDSM